MNKDLKGQVFPVVIQPWACMTCLRRRRHEVLVFLGLTAFPFGAIDVWM